MKTTATTEAVSSPPEEKWHWTQKCRRNASCAGQKPVVDWKNDLQIEGAGRKSKNNPRRSWALNHMGNPSQDVGAQNVVETPPAPGKDRWRSEKTSCKSMKQDENKQNHKKRPHAGRGQEAKWKIPEETSGGLEKGLAKQ